MTDLLGQNNEFLIGAAIGSGNAALAAELGGANFLLAINAGRLRNMGAPSIACMLPIFDADELTEGFAREELVTQSRIPVLLGVNVWQSEFNPGGRAVLISEAGFAGAVNFPSCMHYSRSMQQILARAGRGIQQEVEQLRAVQDVGLLSMFFCATQTQARLAADSGISLICLNLGWNVGGAFGHRSRSTIEEITTVARAIGRLIKRINPDSRFLLGGGPIANAEDLGRIVRFAPIDGYVGGSTIERIPLEVSVADQIDRLRQVNKYRSVPDKNNSRLVAWSKKFNFIGNSKAQLAFLRRLHDLSNVPTPVLLLTEPGMNPTPALQALNGSKKQGGTHNLVDIDVAGTQFPARIRNALFGHRDTIAKRLPALADKEVELLSIHAPERLSLPLQRRLARVLRDGVFKVSGTRYSLPVLARVVLISDIPLADGRLENGLTNAGMDPALVSLMSGWTLRMPPLRDRIDDLMTIVAKISADTLGIRIDRARFSSYALQWLHAHLWPNNEAELRSLLGALAGRSWVEPVQMAEIAALAQNESASPSDSRTEKNRIVDALWRHGFNRTRTARALGISRKTLYNKIQKFGLSG